MACLGAHPPLWLTSFCLVVAIGFTRIETNGKTGPDEGDRRKGNLQNYCLLGHPYSGQSQKVAEEHWQPPLGEEVPPPSFFDDN
jgi:hypothetical protein